MGHIRNRRIPAVLLLAVLLLALCGCGKDESAVYRTPEDLRGRNIAVVTGSVTENMLRAYYGDDVEISYYNSNADMAAALEADKTDAYLACVIDAKLQCQVYTDQHCISNPIDSVSVAFFFPKNEDGDALCAQVNEFIASEDVASIYQAWTDDPDAQSLPDTPLTAENGTLTYACCTSIGQPQCYVRDNAVVGSEIETAYRFCLKYGYGLKIEDYDLSGMLGAVSAGKADFGGSGTIITEERQKSVTFSDVTHRNDFVLTVKGGTPLDTEPEELTGKPSDGSGGSLLTGFGDSFRKTFVTESRWKLFLSGIGTTLLITVLAILFGTLLGYGLYMLCRTGSRVVIKVVDAFMWLINGMPVVVLLMLLFYIVFGASSLGGTWVAVVAFSLVFAVGVIAMLRQSVNSIDPGQLEAAYALGYSGTAAFTKRILPQAICRLLPAYKTQTVSLIKSTAIVGYIAVQDLTKAGDIIRSRTFEAFFPIIATAVFYFLMAALLSAVVRRIEIKTDPKRRTREQILKGVEE